MKTLTKVAFAVLVALTLAACQQPTGGDTTDPVTPTVPTYTVFINPNNGTQITSIQTSEGTISANTDGTFTVKKNTFITLPTITKSGYSLLSGWNNFTVTDNVTVSASWELINYTVKFVWKVGSEADTAFKTPIGVAEISPITVESSPITIPTTSSKDGVVGYTWNGWHIEGRDVVYSNTLNLSDIVDSADTTNTICLYAAYDYYSAGTGKTNPMYGHPNKVDDNTP